MEVLAYISTRGRYDTTLAMAMLSIALQTKSPDKFVLYDDNDVDKRKDIREITIFQHVLKLMDEKGIKWEVQWGDGKGQHHNHQRANKSEYEFAWRLDDDEYAEEGVLEALFGCLKPDTGAVAGLVLMPNSGTLPPNLDNTMENLSNNIQWYHWKGKPRECEHLYSSFLYRTNLVDYNLELSKVAHREETMLSHSLFLKGYKLLVNPKAITYHFRSDTGGIRENATECWEQDEQLFQYWLEFHKKGKRLYVLNNGLGDHFMFRQTMNPDPETSILAVCYPDVFKEYETISIAQAKALVDIEKYNVYKWCGENKWKGHLKDAFPKMYEDIV